MSRLDAVRARIAPARARLLAHPRRKPRRRKSRCPKGRALRLPIPKRGRVRRALPGFRRRVRQPRRQPARSRPFPPALRLVLLVDLIYVLVVATLILSRIARMIADRRAKSAGSTMTWQVEQACALAGAAFAQSTSDVLDVAAATKATAQNFETPPFPASALSVSEANLVLSWLSGEGVRLLECSEPWASPLPSQQSLRDEIDALDSARNNSAQVVAVKKFAAFTAPR